MKLDFISDPGHGWLKVPLTLLVKYGILESISSWSYIRGKFAYLEEDCDADVFMNKCVSVEFRKRIGNKRSRIRNYQRFSVELAKTNLGVKNVKSI